MESNLSDRLKSLGVFVAVFFLASLATRCIAVNQPICLDYQVIVKKGDTLAINCDKMVLMDVGTFSDYWHSKKQLLNLREELPEYVLIIDSIQAEHDKNRVVLDSIIDVKSDEIEYYKENQEELLRDISDSRQKNKRLSKNNKIWRRISTISVGANALLLLILI